MKNNSNTFCAAPWIHLAIDTSGGVQTCCRALGYIKKENSINYNLKKDSYLEAWNSPHFNEIREALSNGVQHENCTLCWESEKAGCQSERKIFNEKYSEINIKEKLSAPRSYDLKLGNTCNLKCRICGPWSSSSWVKELNANDPSKSEYIGFEWAQNNPLFWEEIKKNISLIEEVEIYGGEPFLIKEHIQFLKLCVDQGHSKKIKLRYNSNGTIYNEELVKSVWPYFKSVSLGLSIDNIESRFEYERFPGRWSTLEKNISLFKSATNLNLNNSSTISIFNVFYIPELVQWTRSKNLNLWLNILSEPEYLSIQILPEEIKDKIKIKILSIEYSDSEKNHIENIVSFMYANSHDEKKYKMSKDYIFFHDKKRNQRFFDVYPELEKLLFR